jgi:hypothetical protein
MRLQRLPRGQTSTAPLTRGRRAIAAAGGAVAISGGVGGDAVPRPVPGTRRQVCMLSRLRVQMN